MSDKDTVMESTIEQYKKRMKIDIEIFWLTNSVLATSTGQRVSNFIRENFCVLFKYMLKRTTNLEKFKR